MWLPYWRNKRYIDLLHVTPSTGNQSPANHVCIRSTNLSIKPRPHQQQCRSNIVECYESNHSFAEDECCFDIVAIFGNNTLADTRGAGRGHAPLATWASAQNALKVAIFRLKIEKFSGEGQCPLRRPQLVFLCIKSQHSFQHACFVT